MPWVYTPYAVPLLISAAVSASLGLYAWRRRAVVPCAVPFALFALASAEYAFGYALEVMVLGLPAKVFWAKVEWLGIAPLAPFFLVFALQYAGLGHLLSGRVRLLLGAPTAGIVLLVFTNEAHGLVWTRLALQPMGSASLLAPERGLAFWAFSAFAYALILISVGTFALTALRGHGLYRQQGLVLLAGMLVPVLSNLGYAASLSPVPYLNPTPSAFAISVALFGYAIFRLRFLELAPVAREALVERLRDGVLVVDEHGCVADMNPALEAALGLQASQTIGRPAAEVLERWPQLAAGIAQGKEVEAELDAGEGASRRHYAISISPMPGREGLPAGCIVLLRDVTELQQLAAQFLQAQKMESIGRLAGGVAHDFNNLLTAITGHATFARDALPSEHPARRDVEQVLKGARRAAQLTHQLLAFSRRQAMAPRPANLNDTILDMAEMLGHLIGEDVELAIDPASDLAAVCVDPNQLEQAIINLALNARDAMPDGGTLAIRTVNVAIDRHASGKLAGLAPGRYVALTVADTGTGLSPEAEAHLFEPFFTTKEIGEGTGLGLATVFGIVQQHQGRIVATSAPGQGTTFTIYLPSAPSEAAHAEPAQHEAPCDLPRGSECVLLVEDDPDVRAWAARALRELGYALYEAENGAAALALLERQPDLRPDLLVTDVVMPQMTGKALAARLRATYTALPVLFISGYTSSAVTDHEAGQAFLPKPFTQAALAGRVRDLLDGLD